LVASETQSYDMHWLKLIIVSLLVFLYCVPTIAQKTDLREEFDNIFFIEKKKHEDREYLNFGVKDNLESNYSYYELMNFDPLFYLYFINHFHEIDYEKLLAIDDSVELHKEFVFDLKSDTQFVSIINGMAAQYYNPESFNYDSVSMDEVLNIAVKFFHILGINEEGHYLGKMCTGFNNIEETEEQRQPYIEAFSLRAIFDHLGDEEDNIYAEFIDGLKALYTINMGIDTEDRLLRAQGAMYMYMMQSETLKAVITNSYNEKKNYMPFVIEDI